MELSFTCRFLVIILSHPECFRPNCCDVCFSGTPFCFHGDSCHILESTGYICGSIRTKLNCPPFGIADPGLLRSCCSIQVKRRPIFLWNHHINSPWRLTNASSFLESNDGLWPSLPISGTSLQPPLIYLLGWRTCSQTHKNLTQQQSSQTKPHKTSLAQI